MELSFTTTLQCPWTNQTVDVPLREGGQKIAVTKGNIVSGFCEDVFVINYLLYVTALFSFWRSFMLSYDIHRETTFMMYLSSNWTLVLPRR